jgi:uncharacterized repeat protein (TIGR03837 family)
MQIDLFCRVVDNYGDIGVCWRLARQLVAEHGCVVRLIVDDLGEFRFIAPEIDPALARQSSQGVEIVKWWGSTADALVPVDVVIEAFACDPPAAYVEAMAKRSSKPVWLNLEYLSAEAWVDEIHGMPSQHQRLPLTKHFFCPGFTEASGGLIRETAVGATRRDPSDTSGRDKSLLQGNAPRLSPLQLFAFAYPHAPVRALDQGLRAAGVSTTVTLAAPLAQTAPDWQTATPVPQTQFDTRLADFDFLIVRGEDSFVRAQWAAKPFLWHIYPTDDGAHLVKLDAWLDHYCIGLAPNASAAYRAASHAFNAATSDGAQTNAYELLARNIDALAAHAVHWRDTLMQQTDLATRLMEFVGAHKAKNLG